MHTKTSNVRELKRIEIRNEHKNQSNCKGRYGYNVYTLNGEIPAIGVLKKSLQEVFSKVTFMIEVQ